MKIIVVSIVNDNTKPLKSEGNLIPQTWDCKDYVLQSSTETGVTTIMNRHSKEIVRVLSKITCIIETVDIPEASAQTPVEPAAIVEAADENKKTDIAK